MRIKREDVLTRRNIAAVAVAGLVLALLILATPDVAYDQDFYDEGGPPMPPEVRTHDATGITADSATISGEVKGLGTMDFAVVEFEWGMSEEGFLNETVFQVMKATGQFSDELTGLEPGTTYFYRVRGIGDGIGYGRFKSFTTRDVVPEPAG